MSGRCSCHHQASSGTLAGSPPAAITAGDTVESVLRRRPAARTVLDRAGINHCCGAHLTLGEAAAAAGAPLEPLLAELNRPT